ncbi:hypothetical protein HQ47_08330 [Porphyromonas macacae]|uniref:Uncharacterized protein n=1 Tax=Porphyromonas macacae TaxID=28115 RepID=A0A0A2E3I8_9PORP|nr:hypothetical protein [Porphyromonas macacae]KGN73453.1 hypothetical protein HQ47_08330 [Porphyromonas macacae]SUB88136.1 Uncharacterised protein [Porphyromonas macacae]
MAYLESYISEDDYLARMERGVLYEGFVEGVGYAYFDTVAVPPLELTGTRNRFATTTSAYDVLQWQKIETTEEAFRKSLGKVEPDIYDRLVKKLPGGMLQVQMGESDYYVLPEKHSEVRITYQRDEFSLFLKISAKNTQTNDYRETSYHEVDPVKRIIDWTSLGVAARGVKAGFDAARWGVEVPRAWRKVPMVRKAEVWSRGLMKNSQRHKQAYELSKKLKAKGIKIKPSVVRKEYIPNKLTRTSRNLGYLSLGIIFLDIRNSKSVKVSHIYNGVILGISTIPAVGWIVGGTAFAADIISLIITGETIGDHLDGLSEEVLKTENGEIVDWKNPKRESHVFEPSRRVNRINFRPSPFIIQPDKTRIAKPDFDPTLFRKK